MPSKSSAQRFAAQQAMDIKTGEKSPSDATTGAVAMSKMPMSKLKHFMKMKEYMTDDQKRRLLIGLRKLKESCGVSSVYSGGGNVGGETDITNADNLQTNENEFTSGDNPPETKVIAKTFDTNSDFDSYVNQRRGIEMTPKERQNIVMELAGSTSSQLSTPSSDSTHEPSEDETTVDDKIRIQKSITFTDETEGAEILSKFLEELGLSNQKPTSADKFFIKYEFTDDFGNNTTTVIKKLKEGTMFCWTAFSKYESSDEEGNPKGETDEEGT